MRFGVCTGVENIEKMESIGFDYVEMGLSALAAMDPAEFDSLKERVEKAGIKYEAFNVFFPGEMKVVGPSADEKAISEYVRKAIGRAAQLGGKIVVVGSGRSRSVPEGWEMEKGRQQFERVLKIIGDECARYDITAVLEPLNGRETNLVNTVREAEEFVRRLNHRNVMLLADFYHMSVDGDPVSEIVRAGKYLKHVHISSSKRTFPMSREEDDYDGFFAALRKAGYYGRISIEAGTKDLENDAKAALKLLKDLAG